ncbi:4-lactone dehydrogenase, partial [Durusdinium trenchii]
GAAPVVKERERVENWSGTHSCRPRKIFRPESVEQVEEIVKEAHEHRRKLRCMGSGLSPNGIGFSDADVVTLENMNEVISVDKEKKLVRVQSGALVGDVLEHLAEHGLTLQNLASINQQQIGGFTQVGAHGTGAALPPVEEQIVSMKMVTPGKGLVELSMSQEPEMFQLAKCGLGCFGVVTEVTLQCVGAHRLAEDTVVMSREEIEQGHSDRLRRNRHVRYMWIPFTDSAVVVTSNPLETPQGDPDQALNATQLAPEAERMKPMTDLLRELDAKDPEVLRAYGGIPAKVEEGGFGALRDWLLRAGPGPLSPEHVRKVNKAELEFWRNSQQTGVVDDSFNVLAFDCGGQQLVLEVVLPCGTLEDPNLADLEFVRKLLAKIESSDFPAPAPIEQRWTRGSTAGMSPVFSIDPLHSLHSWVGIILYLPTQDPKDRQKIVDTFESYKAMLEDVNTAGAFDANTHWAKIEAPRSMAERKSLREALAAKYPLQEFRALRDKLDPKGILTNELLESILGLR